MTTGRGNERWFTAAAPKRSTKDRHRREPPVPHRMRCGARDDADGARASELEHGGERETEAEVLIERSRKRERVRRPEHGGAEQHRPARAEPAARDSLQRASIEDLFGHRRCDDRDEERKPLRLRLASRRGGLLRALPLNLLELRRLWFHAMIRLDDRAERRARGDVAGRGHTET